MRSSTWIAGVALVALGSAACSEAESAGNDVPLYSDLGDHHYTITTDVPAAQSYFDQGLRLYYAFNHAEAIRAFGEAARLDESCAMCYWGIGMAYGPNINLPQDSASAVAAYQAVSQALDLAENTDPRERALIEALATRYSPQPPADRAPLDSAYVAAMRDVAANHPDDLEVATLYAESMMDLSPWNYWERDGSPRPHTTELLGQLERVLAVSPDHPGANHFFIHAVEAVDPDRAVPMAERLAGLMPGAGHLVHMPGHIYVRVGRYEDAIAANEHAVHADETFIRDQNPALGVYTVGYYPHNYDFLAFAASMIGRSAQTIDAVDRMVAAVPPEMIRAPGMSMLQNLTMRPLQMRVRFARWDEILAAPEPAADLPHSRAIWQYARGRALLARGDRAGAEAALAQVRAAVRDPELRDLPMEFNTSGAVLRIAELVLAGHVAAGSGDYRAAITLLREAAEREDGLTYGEPPDWSIPVREELGLVLLDADLPAEAEEVFREDLERFPDNGWALNGLARALRAQGRTADAAATEERFETMWASADFPLAGEDR
jgi:tetratricopeptide (TPR) repeat protein